MGKFASPLEIMFSNSAADTVISLFENVILTVMANIYPNDINQEYINAAHEGEMLTLALLMRDLPHEYTVFHSVHWSVSTPRYTDIGEVDFVVINAAGDILLIEQKNGGITEQDGTLYKGYDDKQKDVVRQIERSQGRILEKFKAIVGPDKKPNIEYLIYCPDYRIKDIAGLRIDATRIADEKTPGGIVKKIESLMGQKKTPDPDWLKLVKNILRNSYKLVPDIQAFKGRQKENYIRLTNTLLESVTSIEMHPLRLKVKGTAGCGKSLLAGYFYEQALAKNKKPLLVCFNRPLCDSYKENLPAGGHINTWYGLVKDYLESQGYRIPDFGQAIKNDNFWHDLVNQVIATTVPEEWGFDVIIVDEGQDFKPEWREMLDFFDKGNLNILWLEDELQNIWNRESNDDQKYVVYHARQNYRNPVYIADFIKQTLNIEFENRNNLPGKPVTVHAYETNEEQIRIVNDVVQNLKKEGFSPEDIVVLTTTAIDKSPFYTETALGKEKLIKHSKQYTAKNQDYTEGTLTFEGIFRYKGQQAPAIILVDVNPDPEKEDFNKKLLYTCMTRACVSLTMLVKKGNAFNQRFINYKPH